jgi:hypothetical protein
MRSHVTEYSNISNNDCPLYKVPECWGFILQQPFFLSGEGPRSRRYGRTAAARLIVQPYDEDEDDDYFLSFS